MKSVIALALTATLAAGRRLPAGGAGGDNAGGDNNPPKVEPPSDDGARYEKEDLAKTALLTCLTTKQGASVAIAVAKNECKTDSDVGTAFDDWRAAGKRKPKDAIISEWYNRDPDVMDKLGELYPVTVAGASNADIQGVIGADADVQDIAEYKEKTGKATWAKDVKTCRRRENEAGTCATTSGFPSHDRTDASDCGSGNGDACNTQAGCEAAAATPATWTANINFGNAAAIATAKLQCITDTTADLCTKTADTVPCCATDACTAEDGFAAIVEAADNEMSEKTKKCSKIGGGVATVKTCREGLRAGYEAVTGKTVDAVGKYFFFFAFAFRVSFFFFH